MTSALIDCHSAMRELWDYLDDELPAARTEQIREHLATCVGCQDHVQFCRGFLTQIGTEPVSRDEVSRLRNRVHLALLRNGLAV